jgi:hypothetical protein
MNPAENKHFEIRSAELQFGEFQKNNEPVWRPALRALFE